MNKDRSSRYSKWSWLREKVATRDFGYCLVLSISVIALLALISANGRKTTRLGELEGRINSLDLELKKSTNSTQDLINSLDLELKNGTNSTQDLRTRLEDLGERIKSNITELKLEIMNNTQELVILRNRTTKETPTQKTTPATMATPKLNEGSKKNGTSNADDGKT